MTLHIGILASHAGSNLKPVLESCATGRLDAKVCAVISNNSSAPVLEMALHHGIPAYHLSSRTEPSDEALDEAILRALTTNGVDLVFLFGYLRKLGPKTVAAYSGRILNTHPALLPKFGGQGMYGIRVHEAVLAAGEKVTGATIHLVDEQYDTGRTVAQCEVQVHEDDTPETLRDRVMASERVLVVETLIALSQGKISL